VGPELDEGKRVRAAHIRTFFRLAGALHGPRLDHPARIRYLLNTLCELIDAPIGVMWIARNVLPDKTITLVDLIDVGWPSAECRNAFRGAMRGEVEHPLEPLARGARHPSVITRSRDQLMGDDAWYHLPFVHRICRRARIDHCLYSVAALSRPGWVAVLELHRLWGDARRFSKGDRQLVRVIHSETAWLHEQNPAYRSAISDDALTPRLRTILDHLLQGLSEKQIAEKLKLSYHTVHTQVGLIYQRSGVHSRAELMAQHLIKLTGLSAPITPHRRADAPIA
jgi:DNA-binding CsgD family transcriptional regulator